MTKAPFQAHFLTPLGPKKPSQVKVIPAVEELGKRHASYGVVDKYYEPMGAALIWALEQSLGTDFTPEVKAAWTEIYLVLAGAMRVAAAAAPV